MRLFVFLALLVATITPGLRASTVSADTGAEAAARQYCEQVLAGDFSVDLQESIGYPNPVPGWSCAAVNPLRSSRDWAPLLHQCGVQGEGSAALSETDTYGAGVWVLICFDQG